MGRGSVSIKRLEHWSYLQEPLSVLSLQKTNQSLVMCSLSEMIEIVSIFLPYHFHFPSVKALGVVRVIWLRVKSKKLNVNLKSKKPYIWINVPSFCKHWFFLNKMIPLLRIFVFMNSFISSTLTGFVVSFLLSYVHSLRANKIIFGSFQM